MTRGAFIVIEGLDRSGKTTQTELLAARLAANGVSVARRKFPGTTHSIYRCPYPTPFSFPLLSFIFFHLQLVASHYQIARPARAR